jgi:hypothetical protein
MKQVTGITSNFKQRAFIQLDDGTTVYMDLFYVQQQTGWFMNLLWQDKLINGLRITTSPNMLYKWKNLLPFGLMVLTNTNAEPLNLDDFATGFAKVYLLNPDDMTEVDAFAFDPDYSSG